MELVNSKKLRMTFGTTTRALRKDNDYTTEHIAEVVNAKLTKTIDAALKG